LLRTSLVPGSPDYLLNYLGAQKRDFGVFCDDFEEGFAFRKSCLFLYHTFLNSTTRPLRVSGEISSSLLCRKQKLGEVLR
jgi:hypothetical protein